MSLNDEVKESQNVYEKELKRYKSEQKDLLNDAKEFSEVKERAVYELKLAEQRQPVVATVVELLNWEMFETNFQNYRATVDEIQKQLRQAFDEQTASGSTSGIFGGLVASGLVAGAGMAAPAAAMALASTFGVASTGTAIATLSGAAATNAAVALIGGGSMLAGTAALDLFGPVGWGLSGIIALVTIKNAHKKKERALQEINQALSKLKQANLEAKSTREKIKETQHLIEIAIEKLANLRSDRSVMSIEKSIKLLSLLNKPVAEKMQDN